MQLSRVRFVHVLVAVVVACFGFSGVHAFALSSTLPRADQGSSADSDGGSAPLVGTWVVTVSQTPTGVQFPSLQALVTYGPGVNGRTGTVIETEDDAFAPATGLLGPGHGVWERTSPNHYHYAFLLHQYDASGNLVAIERDDASVTLDGDNFQGTAHFVISDTGGNELFAGDALLSATAFELDSSK